MKTFGLVGKSLSHSFSQQYFTNTFKNENILDAEYQLFSLKKIDEVKDLFQHPTLLGFNVTIPYKTEIIPYLDELDSVSQEVGAVNCVIKQNNKWTGYNTDVIGFENMLEEVEKQKYIKPLFLKSNLSSKKQKALILGSGGAAKTVCYVLKKRKIPYQIVSRNKTHHTITYDEITKILIHHYSLIINTTPLGMYPHIDEKPPLPYSALKCNHILMDLIYNPAETLFLKAGKKHGATTANGLTMFQTQARESYLRFKDLMIK